MEQAINPDKINIALAVMNDEYWDKVAKRCVFLMEKVAEQLDVYKESCTSLAVTQMDMLGAKHKGYQRLAENTKKSAVAKIVSENKTQIGQFAEKKQNTLTEMSQHLAALNSLIEEIQTLGEPKRQKGGDKP